MGCLVVLYDLFFSIFLSLSMKDGFFAFQEAPMPKAQCPTCGSQEVQLVIEKTAEGILDDQGNLESDTDSESIIKMTCRNCDAALPLSIIQN